MRRFAPTIALAGSALLIAACGEGPTRASSAAVVGDERIPLERVQDDVRWLLNNIPEVRQADDEGNLGLYTRHVVQSYVVSELLEVAAEEEDLQVDREVVDERLEAWGGRDEAPAMVGVPPERLERFATDVALIEQLGEHYLDRISVEVIGAEVSADTPDDPMREQAVALGEEIAADPERAAELAGDEGRRVIDETFTPAELVAGGAAELATSALFSAEPGTVTVIQPNPQQPVWLVALITDRTVDAAAGDDDVAEAPQADPNVLYGFGLRMLAPVAEEVGVEINPRYGVWDPVGMSIAESEEHTFGELIPSRTAQP
ncbi:hypothetical protein [Haloechinothrix sp. LS1_15]|uniref:hypothetical protein n=1 Tax=Haloechinothrix sp. LS1_15 TaxID=2652248 RepID=UPI0029470325|nr:hypothetical protein [Haloechinothrix sp. LS1_15]MDV6011495.1 hypothetical protein [Haloechinothrix sp. LS1_15]